MKLYIPSIGDIIKLEDAWTFNCFHTYGNVDILEHFGFIYSGDSNQSSKIKLSSGSELRVEKITIQKQSVYDSFTFSIKFDKPNVPNHITFSVKLVDVNRIMLETTPTSGVLNFPIIWDSLYDMPEKNTKIFGKFYTKKSIGRVNGVSAFEISISDKCFVDDEFSVRVKSIKYKLVCLLSGEVVGDWSTLTTIKKKAKEYIERNKKYFLGDEQRVALREQKFERIIKK